MITPIWHVLYVLITIIKYSREIVTRNIRNIVLLTLLVSVRINV